MSTAPRQLHLGAFLMGVGHHLAAWRHPDVDPSGAVRIDHYRQLARLAERGLFDALFLADNVGLPAAPPAALSRGGLPYFFEPLTLLAALAGVTERIGLIATVSATYLPPYHLARKFATLDHLSGGRSGWNLVTSGTDWEAQNFGLTEQLTHQERYRRATEYVQVVKGLWDSWDDEPWLFDQSNGQFFDPAKLRALDHQGEFFSVRGPLQTGRPVQGHPVIVQAGSSQDGQELAAASAELVFTAQQTREGAQAFYRGLKARVAAHGRDPSQVKILPGVLPVLGRTEDEAQENFAELQALIDPAQGLGLLSGLLGHDLSGYPLDGPLPALPSTEGWQSRQQLFVEQARREQLTIRQLYQRVAAARGHLTVVGTASQVADQLQDWFEHEAADGFNILAPTLPHGLEAFVDQVIPALQRRGLFRTAYQGSTLREHLGLARPVRQPAVAA